MQPLHKIYGLITYLIFTIYFFSNFFIIFFLHLIFIFIQELLERKLQILNFTIYLYINFNDDLKPSKVQYLFNLHEYENLPNKSRLIWSFLCDLLKTFELVTTVSLVLFHPQMLI